MHAQGSGSVLATSSLGLVRARPGLHPGDLSLRPGEPDLAAERQRMGRRTSSAVQGNGAVLDAGSGCSEGLKLLASMGICAGKNFPASIAVAWRNCGPQYMGSCRADVWCTAEVTLRKGILSTFCGNVQCTGGMAGGKADVCGMPAGTAVESGGAESSHVTRSGIISTRPQTFDGLSSDQIKALRLRYFTPREIANLSSFPAEFSFPAKVTLKQRYALLGNSLSALVVADLLQYVLHGSEFL